MSKILKVVGASWMQTKISSYILGFLGFLAILALFVGLIERIQEDGNYAVTIFYSDKTGYRIEYWGQSNELADVPRGVARAYFRQDVDTTGWSLLEIETDGSYPDEIQAYAAGVVEGALTCHLIRAHLENTIRAKCEEPSLNKQCNKLRDALDKSAKMWKTYATDRATTDPFWHHVSLYYTQIGGIYTGWQYGFDRNNIEYEADLSDLYWLNSIAEVAEIQHKLNITIEDAAFNNLPALSSAFLRIVNDTNDDGTATKNLYIAQNAAGSYSSMTRIMKRYKLNYHRTSKDAVTVPGVTVDFSGYPGSVTSQDELYVITGDKHKMVVTGTALHNYNSKLWKDVNITEQVPVGPRVTAANHLAPNVSSWGHTLAAHNSGTACKQWLVVDFNKFDQTSSLDSSPKTQKKEVITESMVNKDTRHTIVHRAGNGRAKGLLWVIEQVPGRTHSADLSDAFIEKTYWATYGLPFFKDIAEITHVTKMEKTYGKVFSESESPRAIIFKRGYKNATSLESIIELMRMNNVTAMYRANNESADCIENQNCVMTKAGYLEVLRVRGDLVKQYREAYGVIDTKVVTAIAEALLYMMDTEEKIIVILTDSKSSIQHLAQIPSSIRGIPVAINILQILYRFREMGRVVVIQWIPSHVGIAGNEEADLAARQATSEGIPYTSLPLPSEKLIHIKQMCRLKFLEYFDERSRSKGIWYKTVQCEPLRYPWFEMRKIDRHMVVALLRLRSGHIPSMKFSYLMRKTDSPTCPVCGMVDDVLHVLTECDQHEKERRNWFHKKFNVGECNSILASPLSEKAGMLCTINKSSFELIGISSPPFTEPKKVNTSQVPLNKGNVASIYTDQFDDVPSLDGLQIRDLVKHQQKEAEQESLEKQNKDVVQPFQWSASDFDNYTHNGLPDKWDFGPFRPNWSW